MKRYRFVLFLIVGLTIYCEATSEPVGWDPMWNFDSHTVIWEYVQPI